MIEILTEPTEETYKLLIDYVGQQCLTFSLVWHFDIKMDKSSEMIHQELSDFFESEQRLSNEWTESEKESDLPLIRHYKIANRSLGILKEAPLLYTCPDREIRVSWQKTKNRKPGLYSWICPALPEDLTFYSSDGLPWLVSIAHEEEAFFISSDLACKEINKIIPDLDIGLK